MAKAKPKHEDTNVPECPHCGHPHTVMFGLKNEYTVKDKHVATCKQCGTRFKVSVIRRTSFTTILVN